MEESASEKNRRLAELLGWTSIVDVGGAWLGTPPAGRAACRGQAKVPDWVGDWRECGPLLAEHVRRLKAWPHRLVVGTTSPSSDDADWMCDRFGVKDDSALRLVIVDAVIAKLEAGR